MFRSTPFSRKNFPKPRVDVDDQKSSKKGYAERFGERKGQNKIPAPRVSRPHADPRPLRVGAECDLGLNRGGVGERASRESSKGKD